MFAIARVDIIEASGIETKIVYLKRAHFEYYL